MSVYVIAEAGACGDGDFTKMMAQIGVCARAKCDAVKFQWTSDPEFMARRRGNAERDGYADIYRKYLHWPEDWHRHFEDECRRQSIDYLCTVYLAEDVSVVAPHVKHFKVSSFEGADSKFIKAHEPYMRELDRRLLISTGMSDAVDLAYLHELCYPDGYQWLREGQAVLMHCTSAYPAPFDTMELRVIQRNRMSGYSDHTVPQLTWTGALAVAAGASYIEAHMRLDSTDPDNPDYGHAMTEEQLTQYVAAIRMADAAMGAGVKSHTECERPMRQYRVNAS
jgi:N,N'-diacetyllegionaminate synthase